jgi:hypothetical protein
MRAFIYDEMAVLLGHRADDYFWQSSLSEERGWSLS